MNKRSRTSAALLGALILGALDLAWFLLLVAWSAAVSGDSTSGYMSALRGWNAIHYPIRRLIDPLLLPHVDSGASSLQTDLFVAYGALCVVQSLALGFVLGLLIALIRDRHKPGLGRE